MEFFYPLNHSYYSHQYTHWPWTHSILVTSVVSRFLVVTDKFSLFHCLSLHFLSQQHSWTVKAENCSHGIQAHTTAEFCTGNSKESTKEWPSCSFWTVLFVLRRSLKDVFLGNMTQFLLVPSQEFGFSVAFFSLERIIFSSYLREIHISA